MKRYILFQFCGYYPEGGWNDFTESFESVDGAKQAVDLEKQLYHIVDSKTQKIIWTGYNKDYCLSNPVTIIWSKMT